MSTLPHPQVLAALSLLLAAAPVAANDVHVVSTTAGPGIDFTSLQDAIDAAGQFDIILIKPGAYGLFGSPPPIFKIDGKSLTLIADGPGGVNIANPLYVTGLAASQQVSLRGLQIVVRDQGTALRLSSNAGSVWVDDCVISSSSPVFPFFPAGHGADVSSCAAVTFMRCSLSGTNVGTTIGDGYHGLLSLDSNVALYDSVLHGGDTAAVLGGGHGASVVGGFLFASGSEFFGGDGGDGADQQLFTPCSSGGDGGSGVHLVSGAPVLSTLACDFTPGSGGTAGDPGPLPPCQDGSAGSTVEISDGTHTLLPGPEHQFEVSAPVREGETLVLTYTGPPGEMVFVEYGGFQGFTYFEVYGGVLSLGLFQGFFTDFVGTLPASGVLTTNIPFGSLSSPTSQGAVVYLQSAFFSPPLDIYQGPSQLTVLLDGSL